MALHLVEAIVNRDFLAPVRTTAAAAPRLAVAFAVKSPTRAFLFAALVTIVGSATAAHSQSLDDQARCAAQSKAAFERWKMDEANASRGSRVYSIGSDFEDHFNSKLNRCLVLMKGTKVVADKVEISSTLMDAYQQRVYATYFWI